MGEALAVSATARDSLTSETEQTNYRDYAFGLEGWWGFWGRGALCVCGVSYQGLRMSLDHPAVK